MSWMRIKALKDERGELQKEMRAILSAAETEKRDLTADEGAKYDGLRQKADAKSADIQRFEGTSSDPANAPANLLDGLRSGGGPAFEKKDLSGYSFLRAVRCVVENRSLDGLEREVSDELAKRHGRPAQGFYFPSELALERRALDLTTGAGAKATITDASNFIDILRNNMVCQAAGARFLTGLTGDLSIPKQTATTTAYWVAESTNVTSASNATIGQISLAPKTVGAYTDLSRKFILQSSISAEQFAREDLAATVARALDAAALAGSGSGAEPTGILNNGSVTAVSNGTNGGAPTWLNIVTMETNISVSNADVSGMAFIGNAKVRGKMKTVLRDSVAGADYLWSKDRTVNGYSALVTNALPSNLVKGTSGSVCSAAIFGNFNDLIFALWSGLDILVDPYTGGTQGTVRIIALQDCDIKLRRTESFSKMNDILTT